MREVLINSKSHRLAAGISCSCDDRYDLLEVN